MSADIDKDALDAIFAPPNASRNAEEKPLPRVAEAMERNRKARAAVARGESLAEAEVRERLGAKAVELLRRLPSKAALEKRWPRLRVNRMTMRWADKETGERGTGLESLLALLAYLGRPRTRRAD